MLKWQVVKLEGDGTDVFVSIDGLRIAKRGQPGTRQAKTWVSIEPGWSVIDSADGEEIMINRDGVVIH